MRLEVIPATAEQAPLLANLLELYAHDFSEFMSLEVGEDGRFGYRSLPLYWSDPERFPFLVRVDGRIAGLVLIHRTPGRLSGELVWDVTEFFVLRGFRKQGIGTQIAHQVWRLFAGTWQVRVMEMNLPAQAFWTKAISAFTGETNLPRHIRQSAEYWWLFTFESKP